MAIVRFPDSPSPLEECEIPDGDIRYTLLISESSVQSIARGELPEELVERCKKYVTMDRIGYVETKSP